MNKDPAQLTEDQISHIIELAWCDKTKFVSIEKEFGLKEKDVKALMRKTLKPSSYRLWRKRVQSPVSKKD